MKDIFALSDRIQFLPAVHGSGNFSQAVRGKILASACDCLAVCLPPEFQATVEEGIEKLPRIALSCLEESDGKYCYVPIDPCQPVIMGLRIAMQEGIPRHFIDRTVAEFQTLRAFFPDTFALRTLSLEKFCASLLPGIPRPQPGSQQDMRVRWMAHRLHALELEYSRIVFICSVLDWPWIKEAYDERLEFSPPEPRAGYPSLYDVDKHTLFFALSEFPYVTYLYERNRAELRSDRDLSIDGVKEILLRAREIFLSKRKARYHNLTSQTFQIYLQYVRNLTLMESRLAPDLYTLAMAAKQTGGDAFAIALIEAARDYPYQADELASPAVSLGIEQAVFEEDNVAEMKNRLSETRYEWRNLNLKMEPPSWRQAQWKYRWNPFGQCSWPPEDDRIESFHTHAREQSRLLLSNDLARSEKFAASVKDGIDMRETLRNWHTGDIYVKEIPPSRGTVEIVVFLFEMEPGPRDYPWRQTWYAEHAEESTLCFFATDYMANMVGPGIGQATYGGCMMIFPPRPIPNIWEDPRLRHSETLEEKLLEAAFFHSRERHVTVVSPGLPILSWRKLARLYKKRIIHIPLKRFSNQTIERVRLFHVLNGKDIRSYASKFIRDM
ncbi:MAG: hypothetical protein HZA02_09205 [Nitrospinae bacterium]|nr:hypothetical protein [Nitrospinota bacterium]